MYISALDRDEFQRQLAAKTVEMDEIKDAHNTELSVLRAEVARLSSVSVAVGEVEAPGTTDDVSSVSMNQTLVSEGDVGTAESYASVIYSGPDFKIREFMFVFSGQGIDCSIFGRDFRMQRVEYGDIRPENGFKYCVMKLHHNCGRRYLNLINVLKEYNQQAGSGFQLNPKQEFFGWVMKPAIYTRKFDAKHPIWAQLTVDRVQRPVTYKPWTNRIK